MGRLKKPLRWRHNDHDGVSNHQPHGCLLNRLSNADQRKQQSSASLAFVWGIHRDRWIPRTKGQLRGKCFHLITSSWELLLSWLLTPSLNNFRQCAATGITLQPTSGLSGGTISTWIFTLLPWFSLSITSITASNVYLVESICNPPVLTGESFSFHTEFDYIYVSTNLIIC